ncbi:YfcZ/YiiS family protein [Vibrio sonorensis]|uniref:YfcZ/YiiS family protein n=1 Tax=Vibrio sonorensis TaxID=1004316 RepID=UPI0008DB17D0|nr:YfcZ/YiiS family protein [Vibrio sonorensis]
MSVKAEDNQVCEACGCAGEMGFIIKEGDDVAEVSLYGPNKDTLLAELDKYLTLAKEVCKNVEHEVTPVDDNSTELTARFKFEVSAEKLIFELKSRSIAR